MRRLLLTVTFVAASFAPFAAPSASAQALSDTLFSWNGYGKTGRCKIATYPSAEDDARTRTFVVRELGDNAGPSTLADARYLAEQVGRTVGVDPADAYWVFHWGAFSFEDGADANKELFLRATFRRTATGDLSTPSWRVVSREDVEEMTDRRFR